MAIRAEHMTVGDGDHVVQLYADERALFATVGRYLSGALRDEAVAVVVTTPEHRRGFSAALAGHGLDVDAARAAGRLIELDAQETLRRFLADGHPDAAGFDAVVGSLLRHAAQSGRRICAYGEMVALLWAAGNVGAAIELEMLWNDLGREVPFSLFCAYPCEDADDPALETVCSVHSAVVGAPGSGRSKPGETRTYAPVASSIAAARSFVAETLSRWGRTKLTTDASIVVSELASNAVRHAGTPFTVSMRDDRQRLRVAVTDLNTQVPRAREYGLLSLTGRGMHIVGRIATAWGVDLSSTGKAVWADLPR
ncbi:MAG: MEDS domain-containing protein [Acidimicrobiia bacterium]|nr:MEDS domain-containing protein [Acidimicrobiia bacterium]